MSLRYLLTADMFLAEFVKLLWMVSPVGLQGLFAGRHLSFLSNRHSTRNNYCLHAHLHTHACQSPAWEGNLLHSSFHLILLWFALHGKGVISTCIAHGLYKRNIAKIHFKLLWSLQTLIQMMGRKLQWSWLCFLKSLNFCWS